jgi:hypothetical protein
MIQIGDKLISFDLFEKKFCCHLSECMGNCCVYGQSGAPIEESERDQLVIDLPKLIPYLKPSGYDAVKTQGVAVKDLDGDLVTPLIEGEECAFSIEKDGITFCAIEKAWLDGEVNFRKPISCHLYPIRVKHYSTFTALNYDQWSICEPGRALGLIEGIPVFRFLKVAITRAFGESFYNEMEAAANLLEQQAQEDESGRTD